MTHTSVFGPPGTKRGLSMKSAWVLRPLTAATAFLSVFLTSGLIASAEDTLRIGSTLKLGEQLTSANGTFVLKFQNDGNLVLYVASQSFWATSAAGADGDVAGTHMNRAIWHTNTMNKGANGAVFQNDGNFVVYTTSIPWSSGSSNENGKRLVVQDDGNVVIYTDGDQSVFDTKTSVALTPGVNINAPDEVTPPPAYVTDVLPYNPPSGGLAIKRLELGDELRSANGTFVLKFQKSDGNLVLYVESKSQGARLVNRAIWNARTANLGGTHCVMQDDGNFVMYKDGGDVPQNALWSTKTTPGGLNSLVVQDDGNVVLYNGGNAFVWQTRTSVSEAPGKTTDAPLPAGFFH
jgi:hypothetical protein